MTDTATIPMRGEIEVVADAVVLLVQARLLPASLESLTQVASVLHVPLEAIRDAVGRGERGHLRPPTIRPAFPPGDVPDAAFRIPMIRREPLTPRPGREPLVSEPDVPVDSARPEPTPTAPSPPDEPVTRWCSQCLQDKPAGDFVWRMGRMVGRCAACRNRSAIQRGMTLDRLVRKGKMLEMAGVTWRVAASMDALAGLSCRGCSEGLKIGELVCGEIEVWHMECAQK